LKEQGPMHLDVMAIIMVELCENFNYNVKESRYKIFKGNGPYCCHIAKSIMIMNFKAATLKPHVNVYVNKSELKVTNVSIFELGVNDFMKIIEASFIELHHEILLKKTSEMQNNNLNIIFIISLNIKIKFRVKMKSCL
jgi:hypothetical protein